MSFEDLSIDLSSLTLKDNQSWGSIVSEIRKGFVPRLEFADERPFEENDFKNHFQSSLKALQVAVTVIERISPSEFLSDQNLQKHFVVPVLILCFENSQKADWTKIQHIEQSYRTLNLLKRSFSFDSICQLLLNFDGSDKVLRWCLQDLRQKLLDKQWCQFPGAQQAFVFILNQITFPNMSLYISEFLPFSLQFTDHWQTCNITVGVQCLRHIVNELSQTELKWYGRDELISNTLAHLLHVKDPKFLDLLFPTIIEFLEKVEGKKNTPKRYASVDGWDKILHKVFLAMEIESKFELKNCYIKHIASFIQMIELGCVRWMTTVVRICGSYLVFSDPNGDETRLHALQVLRLVVTYGSERVKFHSKEIFESLIRLLYEVSQSPDHILVDPCSKVLALAAGVASDEFLTLCSGLESVNVNPVFDRVIQNTFNVARESKGCL